MNIATQAEQGGAAPPSLKGASNDASAPKKPPPHYALKAGDVDPELGKTIKEIVICSELFIVYIDNDLCIQWHTTDDHREPDYCGDVLNLVATLEAQSNFMTDKSMLFDFRKRIGEGLARCLSGYPKETSFTVLKEVAAELKARNKDVSWIWYFQASYWVTLLLAIVFAVSWFFRERLRAEVGLAAFDTMLGSMCGTFGALLSVTARSGRLTLDANAGKNLHTLEGLARIAVGALGALLVALAIKAGLILGGTTFSGNQFALLLSLCICAGASERLVPSLVTTVERVTANGGSGNRARANKSP